MKKLLIFMLSISACVSAQETEFKFTKDGFTDYVIGSVANKTASELYKKTIDWVNITYKNPREVIKAQIENDYIRIEGFKSSMLCKKILLSNICENGRYQIEISFKDGKYKFDVISLESYLTASQYNSGGWYPVALTNTSYAYKESGELRSMYKNFPEEIESTFNTLNNELKKILESDTIPSKKDGW
jgi:hypothetical protein